LNYYIKLFYEIEKRNMLNIVIDILCLSLGLLIGMVFLSQAHSAYDDFYLNQKYMPLRQYVVCKPAVESMRILKNELDEVKAENQKPRFPRRKRKIQEHTAFRAQTFALMRGKRLAKTRFCNNCT